MAVAIVAGLAVALNSFAPADVTTVTSTGTATTQPTTSTTLESYCGSPAFPVESPLENGTVFLKVVTGQGAVVGNGSVAVTHNALPGANGTASYCLRLNAFGSGYIGLAARDSLPQNGTYSLTLYAGYDQGAPYQATIPAFSVLPDANVNVTVTVPSGAVEVVSSLGPNRTITLTATSIGSGSGSSTTSASTSSGPPMDMLPGCNVLAGSISKDGFQLNVYLSSNTTKVGGTITICTYFLNLSNHTLTTYGANNVITITNQSGAVVAQPGCGGANTMQVPPGFACAVDWITGLNGTTTPAPGITQGTYYLNVVVPLGPSSQPGYDAIEFNSTLTLRN